MIAKHGGPLVVSAATLGQGRWPLLASALAVLEAGGQLPDRQHGGVSVVTPDAQARPSTPPNTIEELMAYPALAVYLEVERAAQERKEEAYEQADKQVLRDRDCVAFLAARAAANREYRNTLRVALRLLREAIRKGEVMDAAEAQEFWYHRRLALEDQSNPAA